MKATACALRTERQLPPNDGVAKGTFATIVACSRRTQCECRSRPWSKESDGSSLIARGSPLSATEPHTRTAAAEHGGGAHQPLGGVVKELHELRRVLRRAPASPSRPLRSGESAPCSPAAPCRCRPGSAVAGRAARSNCSTCRSRMSRFPRIELDAVLQPMLVNAVGGARLAVIGTISRCPRSVLALPGVERHGLPLHSPHQPLDFACGDAGRVGQVIGVGNGRGDVGDRLPAGAGSSPAPGSSRRRCGSRYAASNARRMACRTHQ